MSNWPKKLILTVSSSMEPMVILSTNFWDHSQTKELTFTEDRSKTVAGLCWSLLTLLFNTLNLISWVWKCLHVQDTMTCMTTTQLKLTVILPNNLARKILVSLKSESQMKDQAQPKSSLKLLKSKFQIFVKSWDPTSMDSWLPMSKWPMRLELKRSEMESAIWPVLENCMSAILTLPKESSQTKKWTLSLITWPFSEEWKGKTSFRRDTLITLHTMSRKSFRQ